MRRDEPGPVTSPEPTQLWTVVEQLLADRSASERRSAMVVVLSGYFDDSGTNPTSGYCVVAGLMATTTQWRQLRKKWRAALRVKPRLAYFKMSEKEMRRG